MRVSKGGQLENRLVVLAEDSHQSWDMADHRAKPQPHQHSPGASQKAQTALDRTDRSTAWAAPHCLCSRGHDFCSPSCLRGFSSSNAKTAKKLLKACKKEAHLTWWWDFFCSSWWQKKSPFWTLRWIICFGPMDKRHLLRTGNLPPKCRQRLHSLWRSQQQSLGDSACQGTEGLSKLQEKALIPEISMGFKPALNSGHWFAACDHQGLPLCPFVPRSDKLQCLHFYNCWFEGSVKILTCWVSSFCCNSGLSQKQSMQLV